MRNDIPDYVSVSLDDEVETPRAINSGLPQVSRLVILLRSQGWIVNVAGEKTNLFEECFADLGRHSFESLQGTWEIGNLHRERFTFLEAALFLS
jgi:hypothetical protein